MVAAACAWTMSTGWCARRTTTAATATPCADPGTTSSATTDAGPGERSSACPDGRREREITALKVGGLLVVLIDRSSRCSRCSSTVQ